MFIAVASPEEVGSIISGDYYPTPDSSVLIRCMVMSEATEEEWIAYRREQHLPVKGMKELNGSALFYYRVSTD